MYKRLRTLIGSQPFRFKISKDVKKLTIVDLLNQTM